MREAYLSKQQGVQPMWAGMQASEGLQHCRPISTSVRAAVLLRMALYCSQECIARVVPQRPTSMSSGGHSLQSKPVHVPSVNHSGS